MNELARLGMGTIFLVYYTPTQLTVHCPMTRSVRYQPIFNGLKITRHRAHVLNAVVITTVIEMVEIVEKLDGRVGQRSVERVRYVINNYYNWSLWNLESFHSYSVFPLAFGS